MRYLNHAGTSWPKPGCVHDAVARAMAAPPDTWPALFDEAHGRVANAFGVSPADLLPTPGCTQALAVAIADVPWVEGARVLTSSMEHHALVRPLRKLGVEVVEIPRHGGVMDLDAVRRELGRGGVQLVAASMASNVTGELLPWSELVSLAHAHDALCLLDGAQTAGWLPLDLPSLEVDLFAFAGHKGPQAPMGIGGLYVRPGTFLDSPGATCDGEICRTGPSYCDTGSVNLPAFLGLAAGLEWMATTQPLAGAQRLTTRLRERLADRVTLFGGGPSMPTCSFTVPGKTPAELAVTLARHGIVARGGQHCAPRAHVALGTGDAGTLRISFGPGSTEADVHGVVDAIAQL